MKFTCSSCQEEHDLADISFGADAPAQWSLLTEDELRRSELTPDTCVLATEQGQHFFVRACLEIPIQRTDREFTWGVWVSLSERSFADMGRHWEDPARAERDPYFGWLSTQLPGYPDTMFLKTMVHQRAVGDRPLVVLEPTDHPLAVDQRNGIEADRLQQLVTSLLHA